MKDEKSCETCWFWLDDPNQRELGVCTMHPGSLLTDNGWLYLYQGRKHFEHCDRWSADREEAERWLF